MVTIVPAVILAAASPRRRAAGPSRRASDCRCLLLERLRASPDIRHLPARLHARRPDGGVLTLPWAVAVFRKAIQAGKATTAEAAAVLAVAAVVYPLGMLALWRVP